MVHAICASGGLARGKASASLLEALLERLVDHPLDGDPETWPVPEMFWTAWPDPAHSDGETRVLLRGAVLVAVSGVAEDSERYARADATSRRLAQLKDQATNPVVEMVRLVCANAGLTVWLLLAAIMFTALGIVAVAALLKDLLEVGTLLGLREQRLLAVTGLLSLILLLILIEIPTALGTLWLGRRLEIGLRAAFLSAIPRLGHQYLKSRLSSDLAERCHAAQRLRMLPDLFGRFLQFNMELVFTTCGIIWLDPEGALLACANCLLALAIPWFTQAPLNERDLRVQSHGGALTRFYLDVLLGLVAIRTHGAERSVRREHEGMLVGWAQSARKLLRAVVVVESLNTLVGYGCAILLIVSFLQRGGNPSSALLMLFWALNLPALGQEISVIARQFPGHRNVMLRLQEPLGLLNKAARPVGTAPAPKQQAAPKSGVAIRLEAVSAVAAGHVILDGVTLSCAPGEHVAVVGPSGAGKSSLLALLLGLLKPASGTISFDGQRLDDTRLADLRAVTAWVDPGVQLWNRPLLDNLVYGNGALSDVGFVIEEADLTAVLSSLPDGLQTMLGESGGRLSGGEGQRIRLARGMLHQRPRLVLLDEPFRGLDRDQRHALLARAREVWAGATLLCVTHDVCDTRLFPRVVVIEDGCVLEDGPPAALESRPETHYAAMLRAERDVQELDVGKRGLATPESGPWQRCGRG